MDIDLGCVQRCLYYFECFFLCVFACCLEYGCCIWRHDGTSIDYFTNSPCYLNSVNSIYVGVSLCVSSVNCKAKCLKGARNKFSHYSWEAHDSI